MAKTLGFKTVAEGVETEAHQQLLQQMHCDSAQGYYYAKALDEAAFEAFVRARSDARSS